MERFKGKGKSKILWFLYLAVRSTVYPPRNNELIRSFEILNEHLKLSNKELESLREGKGRNSLNDTLLDNQTQAYKSPRAALEPLQVTPLPQSSLGFSIALALSNKKENKAFTPTLKAKLLIKSLQTYGYS